LVVRHGCPLERVPLLLHHHAIRHAAPCHELVVKVLLLRKVWFGCSSLHVAEHVLLLLFLA
jgi:hypothetical protein